MGREENRRWADAHMEELIADLAELVAVPSVSETLNAGARYPFGEPCAQVLDKALDMAGRMGLETFNHEYYGGSALWRGESEAEIAVLGHLDVVPAGEGWTGDPYTLERKGDMLVGRGVRDDKGFTLAPLYAVRLLREQGVKLKHSIRFFFGCNEEKGMGDIQYYNQKVKPPVFSLVPDGSFPVCHGEKGSLRIDLTAQFPTDSLVRELYAGEASNIVPSRATALLAVPPEEMEEYLEGIRDIAVEPHQAGCRVTAHGIGAHSARPEDSDNALVKLCAFLAQCELLDAQTVHLLSFLACSFSGCHGEYCGIACSDQVSGRLTCVASMLRLEEGVLRQHLNIRYPVTADRAAIVENIRLRAEKADFALAGADDNPPCYLEPNHPAIAPLTALCNDVLGASLAPYVARGGTYARKMPTPAVGYGLGLPGVHPFGTGRGDAHQPDEAVSIQDLHRAILIYAEAIPLLDGLL